MRIRRLELAGDSNRLPLRLENVSNGTNVVSGRSQAGKSALTACMAHLLYGGRNSLPHQPDGSIDVESPLGEYRLRRESLSDHTSRLVISRLGQESATSETVSRLLRGVSPAFLSRLYYQDCTQEPPIDWLLSEEVAATVTRLYGSLGVRSVEPSIHSDDISTSALQLDELDDQIQRWTALLHDLERRESQVRTELAGQRPIERSSCLTMADQRGAVAATERLVSDLQAEIKKLERSAATQACVCRDALARSQPLVGLLVQQVTRLTQLTEEREHADRSQKLRAEAKHLARSLTQLRDQLEHLNQLRDTALRRPSHSCKSGGIRGSDLLSRLSEGELVHLKLTSGGRRAVVVDRRDQTHAVELLPLADKQLVSLSLSLAIISGLIESGLEFPLLLDEPFLHLNDRQARILARVLLDFSNHQVFVFTRRQSALEQFRSLGTTIYDLDDLPRNSDQQQSQLAEAGNRPSDSAKSKPALRIKSEQTEKPRRSKQASEKRSSNRRKSSKHLSPLKFCLELQSPIGESPSIPSKVATEMATVGIRQVRDLLAVDASKLADRLDSKIDPVDIVAWQHQARLCCRIPNLKTRDAAILVNCGFSTPEDVAAMKPGELIEFIQSFATTEEGQELLGDEGEPELDAVKNWIRAARHSRVLGAA